MYLVKLLYLYLVVIEFIYIIVFLPSLSMLPIRLIFFSDFVGVKFENSSLGLGVLALLT